MYVYKGRLTNHTETAILGVNVYDFIGTDIDIPQVVNLAGGESKDFNCNCYNYDAQRKFEIYCLSHDIPCGKDGLSLNLWSPLPEEE